MIGSDDTGYRCPATLARDRLSPPTFPSISCSLSDTLSHSSGPSSGSHADRSPRLLQRRPSTAVHGISHTLAPPAYPHPPFTDGDRRTVPSDQGALDILSLLPFSPSELWTTASRRPDPSSHRPLPPLRPSAPTPSSSRPTDSTVLHSLERSSQQCTTPSSVPSRFPSRTPGRVQGGAWRQWLLNILRPLILCEKVKPACNACDRTSTCSTRPSTLRSLQDSPGVPLGKRSHCFP